MKNFVKIQTPLNIFFFNGHSAWGGGEKWHLDMAFFLKKDGHPVAIVAPPQSELARRARQSNIPLTEMHISNLSFLNPIKLFKLVRLLRNAHVEIIILNLPSDLKAAGLAARLAGVSRIIYRRGSAIPIRNTWFNRFLFRYVVSDVIANSEETKRTILTKNPHMFPLEKIHVIYNGIDLQQFDQHLSNRINSGQSDIVILGHVGRLSVEKNQKFLIDVTRDLRKSGVNCCLKIAGKGPLEMELKSYAAQNGVLDDIIFLGFQEDIPSFMASIDIFLLSSHWEGFGYVLIEAMAAKKPVVAFNSSSTPEIVCDGKTGYLVPYKDLNAFVERTKELIADADKRNFLGQSGRKRVEDVFSHQRSIQSLKNFLDIR